MPVAQVATMDRALSKENPQMRKVVFDIQRNDVMRTGRNRMIRWHIRDRVCVSLLSLLCLSCSANVATVDAAQLLAGVGRADITDSNTPSNDPLYAKALVLKSGETNIVFITVDAVAIEEIGRIPKTFLGNLRTIINKEFSVEPSHVIVNASHCHGVVSHEVEAKTLEAVRQAWKSLVAVRVGVGKGHENKISENRRLKLVDGSEADVRHAYSLPADEIVSSIGPIDPEIGVLRIDTIDGKPLAVVYNFACHPIQRVPSGKDTADFPGFSSKVIEENLGEGSMAFFIQGCAGDINPVQYKNVHAPHDAEPIGNLLGLAVMRAARSIHPSDDTRLKVISEKLLLPRASDFEQRIASLGAEREKLLESLQGTSLNFKSFVPLLLQYKLSDEFPSYASHRYFQEKSIGRSDLETLDKENRLNLQQYIRNIHTMERITQVQVNLALLQKHRAQAREASCNTIEVEVSGIRIGECVFVTFPGELTVEVGLAIKKRAGAGFTFVAGYTNGYIYYAPTDAQRRNTGCAQEDCDCILAPQWQKIFENKAIELISKL